MSAGAETTSSDDFAAMWAWFATHCQGYSPIYQRISEAVSTDAELLAAVRAGPPDGHLPPALLAAVHFLVLGGLDHPLSDVYAGRSDADPGPLFLDVCRTHRADVMHLLATRHIQTNDCGRSALIGPGLTTVARRLGARPGDGGSGGDGTVALALVDVGASAGLNLLCDRYRLDYGASGTTGPEDSPVHVRCDVRVGTPPIAAALPPLAARIGIDRSPIDLRDPDDARWLLACVWPDTDRMVRTAASIALAQTDPPEVVAGDAVATLPDVLRSLPRDVPAVVTTTWAAAYLSVDARAALADVMAAESGRRPVAWLSAESAGVIAAFDADPAYAGHDILGLVEFDGERAPPRASVLAYVHEHGHWMAWVADTGVTPRAPRASSAR